jgi:hypothetical protein
MPAAQNLSSEQSADVTQSAPQLTSWHAPGQATVYACGQAPAPSQVAGKVATLSAQLASRQLTLASGNVQVARKVPPHVPPHFEPSLWQGGRLPIGSPLTAEQTPSLPATLQASHCPEQPPSQQ